jgi:hypothetical protein
MSPELRGAPDSIKNEFRAVPLLVFVDDKFVEPAHVVDAIKGAFEMRHYCITLTRTSIEQILVLQRSGPPVSPYKRKNLLTRDSIGADWKGDHVNNVIASRHFALIESMQGVALRCSRIQPACCAKWLSVLTPRRQDFPFWCRYPLDIHSSLMTRMTYDVTISSRFEFE